MFKNKFFVKNPQLNKKFIVGLNKLSEQSERMDELQRELQELKVKSQDAKDETKTNDQSEETTAAKTHREQQFQPKCQSVSIEHGRYLNFLKKTLGINNILQDNIQWQKIPKLNLAKLTLQKKQKYMSITKTIIDSTGEQEIQFLQTLKTTKISERIKLFLLYRLFETKLKIYLHQQQQNQTEGFFYCKELLFQVLRRKIIHYTKLKMRKIQKRQQLCNHSQSQVLKQVENSKIKVNGSIFQID